MKREIAIWKVLAAVVALALVSSGGAAALEADGGPSTQAEPDSRGNLTPERATSYVPLTPCRIVSTTATGDDFAVGETRTYKVFGNLSDQGGQAAGCRIPAAASGIEASITATFVEGPGYLRAFPSNVPEPQATFVNYTAGASTSTGALTIAAGGTNAFKIKNYRSETHVIVDVQGYYIKPIFALVNADGSSVLRSRVSPVQKNGTGQYQVSADVDTDLCTRQVTVGRSTTDVGVSSGFGTAHITSTPANQIYVYTYDTAGNLADRDFLLEVTC